MDPSRICPEDVVCLVSDPTMPGMVCCVGEDSENRQAQPSAHVYWLRENDNDRMEPIADLRILDRALLHGDTVIHGKRKGLVTSTRIMVELRYGDGTVVHDVDTKQLKHLQPFRQGNWVVFDSWLGRVLSCREVVTVRFDDGSQCQLSSTSNGELVPVQKMYERSPLFPSMLVRPASADVFKTAQWVKGSYRRQKQGVVASTRPAEVFVAWIAALSGPSPQPPPSSCAPEALALLNHFGNTWWRLGDRTVFPRPTPSPSPAAAGSFAAAGSSGGAGERTGGGGGGGGGGGETGGEGGEDDDDVANCCEIVRTRTTVDIKYLDGRAAREVAATDTLMFNPGPHEFYPGDLVCDKDSASGGAGGVANTSVVLSADERSRMAVLRRLPGLREGGGSSGAGAGGSAAVDEEGGEVVTESVFDLVASPDFSFRMGDIVLRLDAAASAARVGSATGGDGEDGEAGVAADGGELLAAGSAVETSAWGLAEEAEAAGGRFCDTVDTHGREAMVATAVGVAGHGGGPPTVAAAAANGPLPAGLLPSSTPREECEPLPGSPPLPLMDGEHEEEAAGDGGASSGGGGGGGSGSTAVWEAVGEVVDIDEEGRVTVAWLGGRLSAVRPEEIYRVGVEEDAEEPMFLPEDSQAAAGGGGSGRGLGGGDSGPGAVVVRMVGSGLELLSRLAGPMLWRVAAAAAGLPVVGALVGNAGRAVRQVVGLLFRLTLWGGLVPAAAALGLLPSPMPLSLWSAAGGSGGGGGGGESATDSVGDEDGEGGEDEDEEEELEAEEDEEEAGDGGAGSASSAAAAEEGAAAGVDVDDALVSSPTRGGAAAPLPSDSSALSPSAPRGADQDLLQAPTRADADGAAAGAVSAGEAGSASVPAGKEANTAGVGGALEAAATADGGSGGVAGGGEQAVGVVAAGEGEEDEGAEVAWAAESKRFEKMQVLDDERTWAVHHYSHRVEPARAPGKFLAKVRKEWNLLQSHLPADIFAAAYAARSDLLQAVIRGPQGTPYADGLFFFDVQLPPEYPDLPPRVHYHAHGDRLNPNLYENGKVCLSLLGTWAGSSVESWDAKKSSILQVLVSIQGLILVPEPYYNEPSYDQHRGTEEGRRSSKQYNESAFLLTLQSVMYSCRQPPADFAEFAAAHCRAVRGRVLRRCRTRLRQARAECDAAAAAAAAAAASPDSVGSVAGDGGASLGFALSLERLIPKLEAAFDASAAAAAAAKAATTVAAFAEAGSDTNVRAAGTVGDEAGDYPAARNDGAAGRIATATTALAADAPSGGSVINIETALDRPATEGRAPQPLPPPPPPDRPSTPPAVLMSLAAGAEAR